MTMKILTPKNPDKQLYYEITPQRAAILDLIAYCEGTDRNKDTKKTGYNIIYGYRYFKDFSKHPRIRVTAGRWTSSAAGRYQILDKTWDELQKQLQKTGFKPFPSFEPIYQDQAALFLIDYKRKSLDFVDNSMIDQFMNKCSWEWASIPPPRYGQPVLTSNQCRDLFQYFLKMYDT
jgi:muramidase (phage lysozyme)